MLCPNVNLSQNFTQSVPSSCTHLFSDFYVLSAPNAYERRLHTNGCTRHAFLLKRWKDAQRQLWADLHRSSCGPSTCQALCYVPFDKTKQTAFIWGSCVRLSSESCGQRGRGFSTQTQHTIPKLNKTSHFPTSKYCELNEFSAPRRYQTYISQKYFQPTHPKMS